MIREKIPLALTVHFVSLSYAISLALLPVDVFKDRINYFVYAESSLDILYRFMKMGWLSLLSNEPIWLLINTGLAFFFEPDFIIRLLVFFSALFIARIILLHHSKELGWCLLFLLFPMVIKNHIVHLRQGVAIAFFLIGWYTNKRWIRWVFWGLTPFIHTSFVFVLAIYFLTIVMKKNRLAADLRSLCYIGAAFVISFGLGWLATIVGARQGHIYKMTHASISGLGFLFWLCILIIMWLQGKSFLKRYCFEVGGLLVYLVSYWLIPVSARIFESMLLLILVSGLNLTGWRRLAFLIAISCFCILQYIIRTNQPWLGFGFVS